MTEHKQCLSVIWDVSDLLETEMEVKVTFSQLFIL